MGQHRSGSAARAQGWSLTPVSHLDPDVQQLSLPWGMQRLLCSLGFHRLCPFGKLTSLPGLCLQNGNYIPTWSLHIHEWEWMVLVWNKGIWLSFCRGIAWPSKAAAADAFWWGLPAPVGKGNHRDIGGCLKIVLGEKKEGSKENLVNCYLHCDNILRQGIS